jgi:hypothetical protein
MVTRVENRPEPEFGLNEVITGCVTGGATTIVIDWVMAFGLTPLTARIVNVYRPFKAGVPDSLPVVMFKPSPGGNIPELIANVGAGFPVAANE